jgi:hypothetical protein
MEIKLTKDADNLIRLMYKAYLERRKNGIDKSQARYFGDADTIHKDICPNQNVNDVIENSLELIAAELLESTRYISSVIGETSLSDVGIVFMESHFPRGLEQLLEFGKKIKDSIPFT